MARWTATAAGGPAMWPLWERKTEFGGKKTTVETWLETSPKYVFKLIL
jgi:hypothetical protein